MTPTDFDGVRRAEAAVLGACLRDAEAIADAAELLRPDDFAVDAHRRVYAAVLALWDARSPVDLVTLADELQRRDEIAAIGGYTVLPLLRDAVASAATLRHHAGIVRGNALLGRLAAAGERIVAEATRPTGTAEDAVALAEREVFAVAEGLVGDHDITDLPRNLREALDRVDARAERRVAAGLPTGFLDLDALVGGMAPGQLWIVGARPSVGKTALGLAMARNVAVEGRTPVAFFSLEMSREELTDRLLAAEARVDLSRMRRGVVGRDDAGRLMSAKSRLSQGQIWISDRASQSAFRIAAKARRLKRRHQIGLVVIDYLQLVEAENRREQRYQQVGEVSRRLKALAKDLNCPVLALSQLNRAAEDRDRPKLSHLRESGSLEQDADVVLLLHRPEDSVGIIEVDVAKNRNGPTGQVTLAFRREYTRFENYAAEPLRGVV